MPKKIVFFFHCFRSKYKMFWRSKYCAFSCKKRAQLFKRYRLKHGSYARTEPLPSLYQDCPCTFKSFKSLKVHLSCIHSKTLSQSSVDVPLKFCCLSFGFAESWSETDYFAHLHNLKMNHKVRCPLIDCTFETTGKTHGICCEKRQKVSCICPYQSYA